MEALWRGRGPGDPGRRSVGRGRQVASGGRDGVGAFRVEGFRDKPAAEWGRDYQRFVTEHGLGHVAATVCLPRNELVVRQLRLPPMPDKERAAAVRYQLDGLHPYGDAEVCFAYASLGESGKDRPVTMAVAITPRERVDAWANLFEEAGVAVAAFTVSEATLYAALRVRPEPPRQPLLTVDAEPDALLIYGESASRPLLTAEFPVRSMQPARGLQLALSDLRVAPEARVGLTVFGSEAAAALDELAGVSAALEPRALEEVFPAPLQAPADFRLREDLRGLAVALESACPRVGWRANLLPADRRSTDSRWRWAPTAALLLLLAALGGGFLVRPWVQDGAYAEALRGRIAEYEETVELVRGAKMSAEDARRKLAILRGLGERTRRDLEIFSELSEKIPSSAWLTQMQIGDGGVQLNGEAQAAADLLKTLNESARLEKARFTTSLRKIESGESFQIAAERKAVTLERVAAGPPPTATVSAGTNLAPRPAQPQKQTRPRDQRSPETNAAPRPPSPPRRRPSRRPSSGRSRQTRARHAGRSAGPVCGVAARRLPAGAGGTPWRARARSKRWSSGWPLRSSKRDSGRCTKPSWPRPCASSKAGKAGC